MQYATQAVCRNTLRQTMLSTSFDTQHAARCCQQISHSRLGSNSIGHQHRRCTVVQPCRPPELSLVKVASPLVCYSLLLVSRLSERGLQVLAAKGTSSDGASSSSNTYPFYNRKLELKYLADHCSTPPSAISVVLGPRSTGKIALLVEYMRDRGLTDSRWRGGCFNDARMTPVIGTCHHPQRTGESIAAVCYTQTSAAVNPECARTPKNSRDSLSSDQQVAGQAEVGGWQ